jgi:ATP-binding cassette subfamily F protein 3
MVKSPIAPFSGGEKARLALALIVWQRPNLLLLDEPTNHLDLETREALTEALAQFDGTLLLVSHDRHLLRATTDEFLIVANGQLKSFDGDLDDYRDWLFKTKADAASVSMMSDSTDADAPPGMDRKEQKRIEAQERQRLSSLRKPLEKRLQVVEKQMSELQTQYASIEQTLADTVIYDAERKADLKSILEQQSQCRILMKQLEEEWLQLQETLEQLQGS